MTSRLGLALAGIVALAGTARADEPVEVPPDPPPAPTPEAAPAEAGPDARMIARIRELYDRKDFAGVRSELLAAYAATPHPSLLFALGQVELALEHYRAAIDYYERFIATRPPQDQIDLAQQAIGAARIQLAREKPRRHRAWRLGDTAIVVAGGLAIAGGTAAVAYGHHLSFDRTGTLADYDRRRDRATRLAWIGSATGAAGVLAIGVAVLRWRLRPEDGYEVVAGATPGTASIAVRTRW